MCEKCTKIVALKKELLEAETLVENISVIRHGWNNELVEIGFAEKLEEAQSSVKELTAIIEDLEQSAEFSHANLIAGSI